MIEIEIRARANHASIARTLEALNAAKTKSSHEHDEYFKFGLDTERRLVLRTREKEGETLLTFKGSSKLPEDVAWQEWETLAPDVEALKGLLLSNGLVRVVTIDKRRTSYHYRDFEINLDSIEGLGEFIEVEFKSEDATAGRAAVERFLVETLGIPRDSFVTRGYVPLMLERIV